MESPLHCPQRRSTLAIRSGFALQKQIIVQDGFLLLFVYESLLLHSRRYAYSGGATHCFMKNK